MLPLQGPYSRKSIMIVYCQISMNLFLCIIIIIHSWWRDICQWKHIKIWINWIVGADKEDCQWRYAWLYENVLSCFLKESKDCETSVKWTGRAFQTDGATWWKAWLAKLVLATSTWRWFVELDRSDLDAVWKLSRSARYSGFYLVSVLYVCKATFNRILDTIGSQCRSARTGVMWSRFLAPETTRASGLITLWILPSTEVSSGRSI